jgi:hypothetical protein
MLRRGQQGQESAALCLEGGRHTCGDGRAIGVRAGRARGGALALSLRAVGDEGCPERFASLGSCGGGSRAAWAVSECGWRVRGLGGAAVFGVDALGLFELVF